MVVLRRAAAITLRLQLGLSSHKWSMAVRKSLALVIKRHLGCQFSERPSRALQCSYGISGVPRMYRHVSLGAALRFSPFAVTLTFHAFVKLVYKRETHEDLCDCGFAFSLNLNDYDTLIL
jgi:hypothetical protein